MKTVWKFLTAAVALMLSHAAMAQAAAVTSQLRAQRVEMVEGKAVFKPATDGKPGDIIEYSSTYRNGGTSPVEKLLATVPVPLGTTLVADSVNPAQAQASVNGTTFAPMPLMRTVRQPDGSERRLAIPLSEYRAVRWEIGSLPPSGTAVVRLRVHIDTPAVAAPAAQP